MVIEGLNSEIFFDLIKGLIAFSTEENLLKKNLPNYLRKLNCFCCFVLRNQGESEELIYTLPYVMKRDPKVAGIISSVFDSPLREGGYREFFFEDNFYYCFVLKDYGYMMFGRKKQFHFLVVNELVNLMGIYAKVLLHSQEMKEVEESRARLNRERNLLLTIINNIPVHVIARDEDQNVILNNSKNFEINKYDGNKEDLDILSFFENDNVEGVDSRLSDFTNKELSLETNSGAKQWGLFSLLPLIDIEGHRFGQIGLGVDITAQKTKEQEVQKQKEQYWNIISKANFGIFELNSREEIVFFNKHFQEMSGYGSDELKGRNFNTLLKPRHNPLLSDKLAGEWSLDGGDSQEILVRTKDDNPQWWLLSRSALSSDNENGQGSICLCANISNQKLMDAELKFALKKSQDSSNSKALFLANMSHEIRTPLNGIIGAIRVLESASIDKRFQPYFDTLSKASTHLLSLINNVLDITKIESEELLLNNRDFKLVEVLESLESILKPEANEKQIDLSINLALGMPEILNGDPTRLRQILLNISGNAVKFTEKGSVQIHCSYDKLHEVLKISIVDTGVGMEDSYSGKIFQKFQQENDSNSRKNGGSGLGLYISKRLLDIMGGHVQVKSKKQEGTRFDLQIPMKIGKTDVVTKSDVLYSLKNLGKKRILLVEDNKMNRLVALHTLKKINAEVFIAENGQEALDFLAMKAEQIDIILMDIQMPVLDGKEATKIIRQELKLDLPVVALSAHAIKSEIEECKKIGFNDYLTKPFEEKDLFRVVYNTIVGSVNDDNRIGEASVSATPATSYMDLSIIKFLSDGNRNVFNKMLRNFKERIPELLDQMERSFNEEDWESFVRYSRKLKSSVNEFGLDRIKNDLDYLVMVEEMGEKDLFVINLKIRHIKSVLDIALTNLNY